MSNTTTPVDKEESTTAASTAPKGTEHQKTVSKNDDAPATDETSETTAASDSDIETLKEHFNSEEYQRED